MAADAQGNAAQAKARSRAMRQFRKWRNTDRRLCALPWCLVNVAGVVDGPQHRVLRDFMEEHAARDRRALALDLRLHVPRNRLPLAVRVGRDVHGLRAARRLLELGDRRPLCLAGVVLFGLIMTAR